MVIWVQCFTLFPGLYQPDFGCVSPRICGRCSWQCTCYSDCSLRGVLPWLSDRLVSCHLSGSGRWPQHLGTGPVLGWFTWRRGPEWRKHQWSKTDSAEPHRQRWLEDDRESLRCLRTRLLPINQKTHHMRIIPKVPGVQNYLLEEQRQEERKHGRKFDIPPLEIWAGYIYISWKLILGCRFLTALSVLLLPRLVQDDL